MYRELEKNNTCSITIPGLGRLKSKECRRFEMIAVEQSYYSSVTLMYLV